MKSWQDELFATITAMILIAVVTVVGITRLIENSPNKLLPIAESIEIGTDYDEVVALLGEPVSVTISKDEQNDIKNIYYYRIKIVLNNNKVIKLEITQ
jgi:hypothetical protein